MKYLLTLIIFFIMWFKKHKGEINIQETNYKLLDKEPESIFGNDCIDFSSVLTLNAVHLFKNNQI